MYSNTLAHKILLTALLTYGSLAQVLGKQAKLPIISTSPYQELQYSTFPYEYIALSSHVHQLPLQESKQANYLLDKQPVLSDWIVHEVFQNGITLYKLRTFQTTGSSSPKTVAYLEQVEKELYFTDWSYQKDFVSLTETEDSRLVAAQLVGLATAHPNSKAAQHNIDDLYLKQEKIAMYINAVLEGIYELDKGKVMHGLQGLRKADFSKIATPLSSFYDLVTGIGCGREDFLSLELKHVFALVIRQMAQGTYQWAQQKNKSIAITTKEALTNGLERFAALLEPTKEPCIAAITNLAYAKAITGCLKQSASGTDEWWDKLIFLNEFIVFIDESTQGGATGVAGLASSLLQRFYQDGVAMLKATNEQTLVMQIAAVDAWRTIAHIGPNSDISSEQIEKFLKCLKQYFITGVYSEENALQWLTRIFDKSAEDATSKLFRTAPPYRKLLIKFASEQIEYTEASLMQGRSVLSDEIIQALRNLAFHALVDLYVETKNEIVQCEILKAFGILARDLCKSPLFNADQLPKLIKKSKVNSIEEASLRILVEAIWPTTLKNEADPVALSLASGKAVKLSEKWQIQCTAIEELLKFDNSYLQYKRQESCRDVPSPISTFLNEVGKAYQVTALLSNKFGFKQSEVVALKDLSCASKRLNRINELLPVILSLQAEDKKALLKAGEEAMLGLRGHLARKLKINPLDVDLISDFLRGRLSQGQLTRKEIAIKKWLPRRLNLQEKECDVMIGFIKQGNNQQQEQPRPVQYAEEAVHVVLDKLIDQFKLTEVEASLLNEAFKEQGEYEIQKSSVENLGDILKGFLQQGNCTKITCAFRNLDKLQTMLKEQAL